MANKAVFVILDQFADWEYAPLAAVLNSPEEGTTRREVLFASLDKEIKTSIGGLRAQPHLSLEEIPDDAEALILVGGASWRKPEADRVAPIARRFLEEGKVLGAICDAARFLGSHGLLNHHQHTANFRDELIAQQAYANEAGYSDDEAVRDGQLVTANGNAPFLFAREVLLALGEAEDSVQMWYDFYTMGFRKAIAKYYPEA